MSCEKETERNENAVWCRRWAESSCVLIWYRVFLLKLCMATGCIERFTLLPTKWWMSWQPLRVRLPPFSLFVLFFCLWLLLAFSVFSILCMMVLPVASVMVLWLHKSFDAHQDAKGLFAVELASQVWNGVGFHLPTQGTLCTTGLQLWGPTDISKVIVVAWFQHTGLNNKTQDKDPVDSILVPIPFFFFFYWHNSCEDQMMKQWWMNKKWVDTHLHTM